MKISKVAAIIVGVVIVLSFVYGMATVQYRIFPFEQLRTLMRMSSPNSIPGHSDYYYLKKTFFEQHGEHEYDVVFIGDSLTDGAEWEDLFPSLKIANRGIGGDRTDGILKRLDSIYSTSAKKAFVMVGVNDFSAGVEIDEVFRNYEEIVKGLVSHGMAVHVQSTIFSGQENEDLNSKIAKLNIRLKALAAELEGVNYIDLNVGLAPDFYLMHKYSRDGFHLNGVGYAVWKATIERYMVSRG